jgi:PAS domain S-box-containing protein
MWGVGGLLSGVLNIAYDYNAAVTEHNLLAFFSSVLHLVGVASFALTPMLFVKGHRKPSLVIVYLCVAVVASLTTVAAIQGGLPAFWATNNPTWIRQVVLGMAIILFTASFLIYMISYVTSRSDFHYWYSLALALIATALLAALFAHGFGTSLKWLGRMGQWLGTLYFIVAVVSARRLALSKGTSLTETLANVFTERKKLLADIESVAKFPIENPNPVMRLTRDRILYANPSSETILQSAKLEVGSSLPKYFQVLVFETLGSKLSKTVEYVFGDRTYSFLVVPIAESEYVNLYGVDITEHKKADLALSESMRQLKETEEIAHLGSWQLDLVRNHLYWSDEVYRIFGLQPQEFDATYEAFLEAVHPEDRAAVDAAYSRSLRDGTDGYEIEHRILRKSTDEIRIVHEKCRHIRDESGKIDRSLGMVQDITERKKLETLKDQFISAVTHELRTPLVSIKGYTDYLLTGKVGELPEKVAHSLAAVKDQSDRLMRMTDDLLDYRRLTSGKFEIDLKPVDLRNVVATSVVETRGILAGKKQNLQLEIARVPIEVTGDYSRLVQVVSNLLVNASKFAPENGKIRLTGSKDEGMCRVSVSDDGIGIKSDDLTRVFEPFAAIVKPTYVKGTGLGLSVSKGLVEAHSGRIWAESAGEGKGSTFSFTIPERMVKEKES